MKWASVDGAGNQETGEREKHSIRGADAGSGGRRNDFHKIPFYFFGPGCNASSPHHNHIILLHAFSCRVVSPVVGVRCRVV